MTTRTYIDVSTKPLDDEIRRLEKEMVHARKAVADLITETRILGSVEPDEAALAKKFRLEV